MKLSICMMVKDEEKNIKRCLDNLKPIVDEGLAELIIVDTGSTDNTVDICREYTNQIYFHAWNKDFSDMRNKTISYAKGEWIFIIDADERLDDVDSMIETLKSNKLKEYNTGIIQVKNLYSYQDESKYNMMPSPRLFRNDGSFGYVGAVHNQPLSKEPILSIDIELTHYGYVSTDKELMEKKYIRTVELLKKELDKNPHNLYYLYQLGVSYDMHGDYKKALGAFRKAYEILERKKLLQDVDYTYILGSYARIAYTNGEIIESIKAAKQAIKVKPDYVDMYYILGITESRRINSEEAFKAFSTYIELEKKYNTLRIAKDLSIIMYHINDESLGVAYFEITKYHMKNENYNEAYKVFKQINLSVHRIYCAPKILIELEKYDELNAVYHSLRDQKEKNSFLIEIETIVEKEKIIKSRKLYNIFAKNDDLYGLYSEVKLQEDTIKKATLANQILKQVDFNKEPNFYAGLFLEVEKIDTSVMTLLYDVEAITIRSIIQYLIKKKESFKTLLEEYIKDTYLEKECLESVKVKLNIMVVLLLINLENKNEIEKDYEQIFTYYVDLGIEFIKQLYQIERAEIIYKSINTVEERFFVLMYLVRQQIKLGNKKEAIQYILEAVKTYEAMAKYIDIYKNEFLKEEIEKTNTTKEFEEYKAQIKENISLLVNEGKIEEAKNLFNEYLQIVPNDIDNYSIKAIIAMMEDKSYEAEQVLKEGLEKEPYHQDLLANMSYLMDITDRTEDAIEYFGKAKLFNSNSTLKVKDIITNPYSKNNNELKVIQGTMEIANQMHNLTKGLKNLNVTAKTLNYWPTYLGYKSDMSLDINNYKSIEEADKESKELASKIIAQNDVFHFHFGTSLTLDYSDLALLKELDKKVIMQYWGSDVRLYSKAIKMNPYVKVKNIDEDGIKRKLELISKYVPHCIVDHELAEYVKDYHPFMHYSRSAIDLNKYKLVQHQPNDKMLIVHAPTSPEVKGSQYILAAIESLKEKYDFEFKLVQEMTHEEAKRIYQKADLIIDQLLIGSYGVFAVETMAMGKPVISWISDFMKDTYAPELPIICANPDNIKEKIEYAIQNRDMLKEIGKRSRAYVEKYHDMNVIARDMLKIYETL